MSAGGLEATDNGLTGGEGEIGSEMTGWRILYL